MGERHYVLVPVAVSEKPYIFRSARFLKEVEGFVLRCLKTDGTISLCGLYEGAYPVALLYDNKSRRLFLSCCPQGDDYTTIVYEPDDKFLTKYHYTDELVANYIARNIMNDIEELL
jgi:hypothetical protein